MSTTYTWSTTPVRVGLVWRATGRVRRLALVAGLALAGAVVTGHGELAALAVVPLVVLAGTSRSRLPRTALVGVALTPLRCVEGDELTVRLELDTTGEDPTDRVDRVDRVEAELVLPPHTEATHHGERWTLVPHRWGRYRVGPLRLRLTAGTGCYRATASVDVGEIVVYPAAAALARAVAPRELAAPLGEHASRAAGSGVEFAGVRPYATGDRRRDIDWRTSARHQDLFVRQYAAERAFDLVLVLDTAGDAGEPGSSTLDLTVRAASGLASSYLRSHDRVGVLTFGGPLHWLSPATGPRHRYRIYEALMSVRPDETERDAGSVEYGLENLPSRLLPRRAFVALLTPMLDDRPLGAVTLLRERGFTPLVVDVLNDEPTARPGTDADLAVRTWRLHREAVTAELAGLGVAVVPWDGEADLTGALLHAMRSLRPEVRT